MAKSDKPKDLIGYEALQQQALRGVVRAALERTAVKGLPGDHHFYLTFRTDAPGVKMPPELIERYPEEMTIVLQNQFWDLKAGEKAFSVTLQFSGQPKPLSIPYTALSRFWDPSVQYLLIFAPPPAPSLNVAPALSPPPASATSAPKADDKNEKAQVVSLDQFRKK
ncbi:MAG TPA: ClpXP protease specificity-enhancing factor SspB [Caulobacteraceae bacterium]|nr:ClpXP protease specificity-enhancing factor SspB [Caulobacteraceae bacterium]